jgi:6-pyruvoyl-tetrahydropterin synthase
MTTLLYTTFSFEASHSLAPAIGLPQIHGHSYWARVWVASPPEGVTPLPGLEAATVRIKALLDHRHLNDVIDHEPTMERIIEFIRAQWEGPPLTRVRVWRESLGCGAEWRPDI